MAGMNDEGRQWYVVNTYSGHENKVKENLEKRVESMGLQDSLNMMCQPISERQNTSRNRNCNILMSTSIYKILPFCERVIFQKKRWK